MAVDQLVYKLNKSALEMLRSGKAVPTSGGIRDIETGRMLAQAKPVMTKTFTQKEMLAQLANSVQMVQALSWINIAISLVNVGVSVVGFQQTLNKMESMHGDIRRFIDSYDANHRSDTLEQYENHLQKIKNHLSYLQSRYTAAVFDQRDFMNSRADIESECIETANFIGKTMNALLSGHMETRLACQIIFTLAPVYAQLVNEYCCQYYCLCRQKHNQFDFWVSRLEEINSEEFRTFMKKQMAFCADYAELHPQRRKDVLDVAFDSVQEEKERLLLCAEAIQMVPENSLVPVEIVLQEKLWKDLLAGKPSGDDEKPEEYIARTLMQIAIDENDEEVYIPVQARYA